MFDFRLHLSNSCQHDCVRFALKFILLNFQVDNSEVELFDYQYYIYGQCGHRHGCRMSGAL